MAYLQPFWFKNHLNQILLLLIILVYNHFVPYVISNRYFQIILSDIHGSENLRM